MIGKPLLNKRSLSNIFVEEMAPSVPLMVKFSIFSALLIQESARDQNVCLETIVAIRMLEKESHFGWHLQRFE